jgi:hypothetical protein
MQRGTPVSTSAQAIKDPWSSLRHLGTSQQELVSSTVCDILLRTQYLKAPSKPGCDS